MERINIYSDDTFVDKKNFIISTFVWSDPSSCREYDKEIKKIIKNYKNKNVLDQNFRGFHAVKLNHSNWNRLSRPFEDVLSKFYNYIYLGHLSFFIYLESKKKYEINAMEIENLLREKLQDINHHIGETYQHIREPDLIPIYKSAFKMYHYFFHRGKFGDKNTEFEYYPDSSGKILEYKNRKFYVETPTGGQQSMGFIDLLSKLVNALAIAFNTPENLKHTGWDARPENQILKRFEPMKDEDSSLIQTCDIISNFFLNLIKYLIGDRSRTVILKADLLSKINLFDLIVDDIKKNFEILNGKCVSSNDDLKVSVEMKSDFKSSGKIIFPKL